MRRADEAGDDGVTVGGGEGDEGPGDFRTPDVGESGEGIAGARGAEEDPLVVVESEGDIGTEEGKSADGIDALVEFGDVGLKKFESSR